MYENQIFKTSFKAVIESNNKAIENSTKYLFKPTDIKKD